MRLTFLIALRYLFSPKRHNAVNVISMISVAGVAVATAAMVVVLSVFNGFADLAARQLSRIDPPLAVSSVRGKVIENADSIIDVITGTLPATNAIPVINEQALAVSAGNQMPVRILGVPDSFVNLSSLDSITIDGEAIIEDEPWRRAVSSVGVAMGLNVRPGEYKFIELYAPRRRGKISTANPATAFRSDSIIMAGVYQVEQENYDTDMLIIPLQSARRILDYTREATSVYIYPSQPVDEAATALKKALGSDYRVATRIEQQSSSFKMISVEKWITFLILVFILVISSFNIISTMAMLIIEKESNMAIFRAMGATPRMINTIFVTESWLITLAGGIAGIIIGIGLSLAQQFGGFIKLNTSNPSALSIDTYPVVLDPFDLLTVGAVIIVTGALTGLCSVRK